MRRTSAGCGSCVIAAVIVALDQWSKNLIEASHSPMAGLSAFPEPGPILQPGSLPEFRRGVRSLRGQAGLFVVVAVVVIVIIVMYSRYLAYDSWWMRLALGLMLGGAMGNLLTG